MTMYLQFSKAWDIFLFCLTTRKEMERVEGKSSRWLSNLRTKRTVWMKFIGWVTFLSHGWILKRVHQDLSILTQVNQRGICSAPECSATNGGPGKHMIYGMKCTQYSYISLLSLRLWKIVYEMPDSCLCDWLFLWNFTYTDERINLDDTLFQSLFELQDWAGCPWPEQPVLWLVAFFVDQPPALPGLCQRECTT